MIRDIHPKTAVGSLGREFDRRELLRCFPIPLVAALVGMSPAFMKRVLGVAWNERQGISLAGVLALLEQDAFAETFVPRSKIPKYLLSVHEGRRSRTPTLLGIDSDHELIKGNAVDLLPRLSLRSVQTVVTSTPYWGMRVYDDHFVCEWADGEVSALGNEQTPEGFIRHSVEILFELKPALRSGASVWWNLMDTYNTRTQIRSNASETLNAMRGNDPRGWRDHACRRYSAGHAYLKDGEQCQIPGQVASRASRVGYFVKSMVSWKKNGSLPETVDTRVTREVEYIIHLAVQRSPQFDKKAFLRTPEPFGGRNRAFESEKLTDVWHFATATGLDGHGAQFPIALPGRCIALSSRPGDLVLDPFVGSGTTSVAALLLGRRSLGFEIAERYLEIAKRRMREARERFLVPGRPADTEPMGPRQGTFL